MKKKLVILLCFIIMIGALIVNNFHQATANNIIGESTGLVCEEEVTSSDGKVTKRCTLQLELTDTGHFNTVNVSFTLQNIKINSFNNSSGNCRSTIK